MRLIHYSSSDPNFPPFSNTLTFSGNISGSGTLAKLGTGTLTLSGANTFTGGTTVAAGNLCVMGSIGAVEVDNGGTLSGTGSVGNVTVYSGGIVSPGRNGGNGVGTLNTGNVSFQAGSYYYADLANGATASDRINVTGTVSLGGATLTLRGSRTRAVDEALMLILNDGSDAIDGTFAGLSESAQLTWAGVTYQVTYQRNGDGTANDMALITL